GPGNPREIDRRRNPGGIVMVGTGVNSPCRVGNAVIHYAIFAIHFRSQQRRLCWWMPQPDSRAISHNKAPGFLHARAVDLKAFVDELMPALVPEISIELFSVDVRPVENLLFVIP